MVLVGISVLSIIVFVIIGYTIRLGCQIRQTNRALRRRDQFFSCPEQFAAARQESEQLQRDMEQLHEDLRAMGIANDNFEDEDHIETLDEAIENQDREAAQIEANRIAGLEAAARAARMRRQRSPRLRFYDSAIQRRDHLLSSVRDARNRLPNINARVQSILARQRERLGH